MNMSGRASLYSRSASDFSRRSYSRLCGVLISRQPAARNFSTTKDPRNPFPPLSATRRFSQNPISGSLVLRCSPFDCFHHTRYGILPVIPVAEFFLQDRFSTPQWRKPRRLEVRVDHDRHQFAKSNPRLPSEFFPRLSRIRYQAIHFQRSHVPLGSLHMLSPIQSRVRKRFLHKFLHGMRLARSDHDILGRILLQHFPYRFHILRRVTPVPPRIEIAKK